MAESIINLQEMAKSIYDSVLKLNKDALNLIGLDAVWCRCLPKDKGEDIIVQEYTLHSYECPREIKIISNKTDYSLGNFSIDMFGIHQEVPLEISIDTTTWESIYGVNTMPLQGDWVFIPMLHRPFEVISAVNVFTLTNVVTSFKCLLGEWKHQASRQEAQDFKVSMDELTDSQDRLFGEAISREVADAVVEVETSFQGTTYIDPLKDYDIDSIVTEDILGPNGNVIASAYYDFLNMKRNISYNVNATFDPAAKENHWIFSTWLSSSDATSVILGNLKLIELKTREKDYWTFSIQTNIGLDDGEEVTIFRGGTIRMNGHVRQYSCDTEKLLLVPTSSALAANKKIPNWWQSGVWRIQKAKVYNILTGYKDGETVLKFDLSGNNLILKLGDVTKSINIVQSVPLLDFNDWHYLAIEFTSSYIRAYMVRNVCNLTYGKYVEKFLIDEKVIINNKIFSVDNFAIESQGLAYKMCNIRLYESEYDMGDTLKIDMYSAVTRNASKLILVDAPRPANKQNFTSPIR